MRTTLLLSGAAAALALAGSAHAQLLGGHPIGVPNIGSTINSTTSSTTTITRDRLDTNTSTDTDSTSRIKHKKVTSRADASASAGASAHGPNLDPVTGQVRSSAHDGAALAGSAVRDTRRVGANAYSTASSADPSVSMSGGGSAQAGRGGASASGSGSASISPGLSVRDTAGRTIGQVVSVSRNEAGQAKRVVVRSSDGVLHTLQASDLSVSGNAAVTSEANLKASPH